MESNNVTSTRIRRLHTPLIKSPGRPQECKIAEAFLPSFKMHAKLCFLVTLTTMTSAFQFTAHMEHSAPIKFSNASIFWSSGYQISTIPSTAVPAKTTIMTYNNCNESPVVCYRVISQNYAGPVDLAEFRAARSDGGRGMRYRAKQRGADSFTGAKEMTRGQLITVVFDVLEPFVMFQSGQRQGELTGYLFDLWSYMEDALGFKSLFLRVDTRIGREMLRSGRADVLLHPSAVNLEFAADLDHTLPVASHWYQLYLKSAAPEVSTDAYIRAMSPRMQLMTFATLTVLAGMIWFVAFFRRGLGLESGMATDGVSLTSSFLTVLGGLCSQGWQESPRCASLRIIAFTGLLFGYLVFNAYSAVLVSYLAGGKGDNLRSLEDLAAKGTRVLCMRNDSYAYSTFQTPEGRRLWSHLLNRGPCLGAARTQHLAIALCVDNTAILEVPSVMSEIFKQRPPCLDQVAQVPGKHCRTFVSLLLRKGFPFRKAFDFIIMRGTTSGILDRLQEKWLQTDLVESSGDQENNAKHVPIVVYVSLEHVRAVLILYTVFLAVPVFILILERTVANHRGQWTSISELAHCFWTVVNRLPEDAPPPQRLKTKKDHLISELWPKPARRVKNYS